MKSNIGQNVKMKSSFWVIVLKLTWKKKESVQYA